MPDEPTGIDADDFDVAFEAPDPAKPNGKEKAKAKAKANGAGDPTTDLGDNWLDACQTTSRAEPRANLYNAELALRNDPAWLDLGFDEMLQAPVLRTRGTPVEDVDVCRILSWMQAHGLQTMGIDAVHAAVATVSRERPFHPLRETLDRFADDYDGELRMTDWLTTYLGVPSSEYSKAVGSMFLTAMMARIYQPGCKADYMLVLEGPQGKTKSMAIQALAGDYFSDTLPDLSRDPVRVAMHLRGKWLVEVSELSSFGKTTASHLKAFLTTKVEQYTPKYGRIEVREPRQCLFVGTTNKHAYLLDETGGRRFWPIVCGDIKVDALRRDRPNLLAEALLHYRSGAQWWPDPAFEEAHISPVQASRFDGDAWEQALEEWDWKVWDPDAELRVQPEGSPPFYLADIARGALRIPTDKLTKRDEQRLVTVLEISGWSRSAKTKKGRPWRPPLVTG